MFRFRRKKRGLVLGLDGVPGSLLKRLADEGVMPFMGELLESGVLHGLKSALPEISSVNWSSFMTGANPGTHGIFGFTDLKPRSYTMTFPAFSDLKTDTLWDELGAAGRRCLVINQPACYPARPIPGALVSGFVAVELRRAVLPAEHLAPLKQQDYRIDVETKDLQGNADALFQELDACLASRRRAIDYFLGLEQWDFAEVVLTGTDRLQHFLWNSCEGDGPESGRARDYYARCDAFCRDVVRAFYPRGEPDGLFLLSDHGFTRVREEFALNAWLRDEGYLVFGEEPPGSYADISRQSQAFAMDPGRVYVHRKGRFPNGDITGEGPVEEIREKLAALSRGGEPVFQRVWRREEIYDGPESVRGPDLVCTPREGIDVKGAIKRRDQFSPTHFEGMHTWDGAFLWARERTDVSAIPDLRGAIVAELLG